LLANAKLIKTLFNLVLNSYNSVPATQQTNNIELAMAVPNGLYSLKDPLPKGCKDITGGPIIFLNQGGKGGQDKKIKNSRWAGKQLVTQPRAHKHGYFSQFAYKSEPYVQNIPYLVTQPVDKRPKDFGFGSRDAFKTDEFTNAVATEVYRETLRKEKVMMKKGQMALKARMAQEKKDGIKGDSRKSQTQLAEEKMRIEENELESERPTLYDLCHNPDLETYGSERRAQILPTTRDRNYGHVTPMSTALGWGCNDKKTIGANRAKHGTVNRTGEFFDPGHLQLGAFSVQKPEDTIGE
jgi:hypothetical protein